MPMAVRIVWLRESIAGVMIRVVVVDTPAKIPDVVADEKRHVVQDHEMILSAHVGRLLIVGALARDAKFRTIHWPQELGHLGANIHCSEHLR